ncbi:MAG: hypothetical protein U0941_01965 [Planctomycetaceae bacterium]
MSFKSSIWAGRFESATFAPRNPIPESDFVSIFSRFADRDDTGELIAPAKRPGWEQSGDKKLIGFIAKEYVIYHSTGFVEVVFLGVDRRLRDFLIATHRELGCIILDANTWNVVTDDVLV